MYLTHFTAAAAAAAVNRDVIINPTCSFAQVN